MFGKPPRRFYETLQIAAKDEAEAKELEFLQSKEGKDKFKVCEEHICATSHFISALKTLLVFKVVGQAREAKRISSEHNFFNLTMLDNTTNCCG